MSERRKYACQACFPIPSQFSLSIFSRFLISPSRSDKWSDKQDMSSFQVVGSSPTSGIGVMETSNFAHVIFQNVRKSFLPQEALECRYTLTSYITPNPKDWVGIFKVTSHRVSPPRFFGGGGGASEECLSSLCWWLFLRSHRSNKGLVHTFCGLNFFL